jgi:hypothetical protein
MEAISNPSMVIWPPAASKILKRQFVREDFPAPVLPTTPTCEYSSLYILVQCAILGEKIIHNYRW